MSGGTTPGESRQRLDKWLWYARILKSRTRAQKLVQSGAVRVDGTRVTGADTRIGPGNVLTMTVHDRLRVLRVLDPGTRRGPAAEAATLYEDISPAVSGRGKGVAPAPRSGVRPPGAGRPTKRERRETDRLKSELGLDPDG